MIPSTSEEWRRAIVELKRLHLNRRHRACFNRCNEILDGVRSKSDIEPVYLIHLHFYAATAMEMSARSLSTHSTYRAGLFRLALEHYDLASSLIRDAECSATCRSRPSPSLPSLSSPQSPESASSRTWTSNTGWSTPTLSVCSSEDLNARLAQSRSPSQSSLSSFPKSVRKKVAFELPKEELAWPEPCIRPDSPTLGFDDEYFVIGLSHQDLPEIPSRPKSPLANPLQGRSDDEKASSLALSNIDSRAEPDDACRFLQPESPADRYCAHLSDLKYRIAQHKAQLGTMDTVNDRDLNRCPTPIGDEKQALERKARIERLRKGGWQRKRFDPSRYEALRNAALAELC
ncbi:hypothetical protein SEPCBS119000_006667 [Sporothrix epigloea]|uniref:Uncharacterized protein n=1 Tax=Sporothrix epigloea TaxID=1892477 RepID=A0ABP0E8H3_9PEZI